jgi:hypothetical protein
MIDLAPPFLEGAAATPPTGLGEAAEIPTTQRNVLKLITKSKILDRIMKD